MCFTGSANPGGGPGSLGKGVVDQFIGDRGAAYGTKSSGNEVVLNSEDPRGEDFLTCGGDAACLVDQLLGTTHTCRLTLK